MANILVRADNSSQVGMGHFNRCSALAHEFAVNSHNVFLVTSETSIIPVWIQQVYKNTLRVSKEWDIDSERPVIEELLRNNRIDIVIIDTYRATKTYYEFILDYANFLVVFDDMGSIDVPAKILINGNIYAPQMPYSQCDKDTLLLLGSEYLALRPLFKKVKPIEIRREVKKVLITFGGGDILNSTPVIINTLMHSLGMVKNMEYYVLVGPGFKNIDQIEDVCKGFNNIKLIFNPENVVDIMKEMDLAISAAGSTVYELACLGIPNIIFTVVDNQELIAKTMCNEGICLDAGDFNLFSKEKFLGLMSQVSNYYLRRRMQEKALNTFDALGAERCVDRIVKFASGTYE